MNDQKRLDSIDFRVQRHSHLDLRPALWVSFAIGLVSLVLAILQIYKTIDLRSRLKFTEMQVKAAEAKAADLASQNQKLFSALSQANTLNESLRKRLQAPTKPPARNGAAAFR